VQKGELRTNIINR